MRIDEFINKLPATSGPGETLDEAEQKMQGTNCAFLPVTAGSGSRHLVGMIIDGDICMAARRKLETAVFRADPRKPERESRYD